MIVVDASVVVTALVDDGEPGRRARSRLLGEHVVAPELIDVEVVSVLRRLVLAGRITPRRGELAVEDLASLPLDRMSHVGLVSRCWELRDNLTAYDACYAALAELLDVLLLTGDAGLAHAPGPTCTVELLED